MNAPSFTAWAVPGIGEIDAGDDLAAVVLDATRGDPLQHGDIVVITSKIVSKAEGRTAPLAERERAIRDETVRVVATRARERREPVRIVESRLGIVGAAAGVDASNAPEGMVLLLPLDPDGSALRIATALRDAGPEVGVVISDTLGRPWRDGQTDIAIGAAGVHVFDELEGTTDVAGRPLTVTRPCLADEIAGAAELVKPKAGGTPVTVLRGLDRAVGPLDLPGARSIVRPAEQDLFRWGAAEAFALGLAEGRRERRTPSGTVTGRTGSESIR
ncbi:coenzyme F420-0:L-glutamate ligase [Microbacterium sp.]|uniref:coenzyme F420-0:L-glutamate ligase n=1 Tax=Microbacterium sp. TaxID=51671 RepID=UPI003340D927